MTNAQVLQQDLIKLDLQLPKKIFLLFKKNKQDVVADFKQQTALNKYKSGELSLGQAAELAGMPKVDFLDFLSQNKVSLFNYSQAELAEELSTD